MRIEICLFLMGMFLASGIGPADADQLQSLLSDLESVDTKTVCETIAKLGESGAMGALPPLLNSLRDKRAVVRQYAVEALQQLARTLDDTHILVKRWLQSLINKLQIDSSDDRIIVEGPDPYSRCRHG